MKPLVRLWPAMIVAIVVSYYFIDRSLCSFIYDHAVPQQICALFQIHHWPPVQADQGDQEGHSLNLFVQLVEWPPILTGLAPFLLLATPFLKSGRFRTLLILMSVSILFTFGLKNELKWIFSRDWPLTWTHNNPSWIGNQAYGFLWFQGKLFQGTDATGSFPSGHTAIAFASFLPIGLIYRRLLPFCIALAIFEGLCMVVMDYHFFSDILAGALVGTTCTLIVKSTILPSDLPADSPDVLPIEPV